MVVYQDGYEPMDKHPITRIEYVQSGAGQTYEVTKYDDGTMTAIPMNSQQPQQSQRRDWLTIAPYLCLFFGCGLAGGSVALLLLSKSNVQQPQQPVIIQQPQVQQPVQRYERNCAKGLLGQENCTERTW